jgi:ABC-type polysaccharide/polyol phosphate export permease
VTNGRWSRLWADVREIVNELVEYRELLVQMVRRDLLLRYKQAAMGFAWAVFMPLTNTALFSIVFTRVAPIELDVPYPLFAFIGLLAWNFTASALRFSMMSLASNVNLVTKVYFPREIFPVSAVVVAVVDTLVGGVVLAALMAYYQVWPGATLLYLPAVLAVHLTFTTAIGFLLAMGNLFLRDVKYLFEVGIPLWMFASSVVYPISVVPGRVGQVLRLNPMTPILDAYRDVLLYDRNPFTPAFMGVMALTLVVFVSSALLFHRTEFKFAESV